MRKTLDSDEDINDRDGEKTTGLIWAVVAGHESLADSTRSRSALHWAALNGDLKTVQLLLSDEMVDMNCTDRCIWQSAKATQKWCRFFWVSSKWM